MAHSATGFSQHRNTASLVWCDAPITQALNRVTRKHQKKSKLGASYKIKWSVNSQRWRRQWHPTPVLLPGKSHGWRSLEGCSPWGHWGSDATERLHLHFSLSCIGEGNGNPLQCSCLENPRDSGAWWAAVYGVALSRTRWSDLAE